MPLTAVRQPRPTWRLVLVAIWVVLGLMTSIMALSVGFLFDAPGANENRYLIQAAYALAALPVTFYLGAIGLYFLALPWLRLIVLALPLAAAGVAMHGFAKIDSVCGGKFACHPTKD